ncbi:methyltransferase domain-containing protein [Streptomyces sp. NPDC058280]|uniref:methyltransferase domain-containing protein n=1 Tax=Streptomyces sp. NPDC058280 TaxID=3346419 RepID=UPI0036EDB95C
MTRDHSPAPRPGREGLERALVETCAMSSDWAPTFAAVDRAAFLPGLVWPFDMERGTSVSVDRAADPGAWYAAADSNIPIVTQWDDGKHSGTEPGRVSTSSSSMPSVVYAMLRTLALDDGMRVLDVGTGTGETAGALFHRCGPGRVTTIEVDRSVSERARERLATAGLHPQVVAGDGRDGYAAAAPYDRVLATVGVREIPGTWISQTRPGGLIVAPWGTHYSHADAVARLVVGDGEASGHFTRPVEFMKLRAQRLSLPGHGEYVPPEGMARADTSTTTVTEAGFVTGKHTAVPFALGLRVRDCAQADHVTQLRLEARVCGQLEDLHLPIGGTLPKCDPFGTPSTSPWTDAAITVRSPRTKICTVTTSGTSTRPMRFSLAG